MKMKKTSFTLSILLLLAANAPGAEEASSFTLPVIDRGKVLQRSFWDRPGYRLVSQGGKGPGLLLTCPPEEEKIVRYGAVRLSGRLDPRATLLVNGEAVPVNPTGSFVHFLPLELGVNPIAFRASGPAGETNYTLVLKREEFIPSRLDFRKFRRTRAGRTAKPSTPLHFLPDRTRLMTLDEGTLLKLTGRGEGFLRVELSAGLSGYVPEENAGWDEPYPSQPVPAGNVVVEADRMRARFSVPAPVPARLEYLSPNEIRVIFYNSTVDTETINLGDWKGDCRWEQPVGGEAAFRLKGPLSCYRWQLTRQDDAYLLTWKDKPRGRSETTVFIDPGHGGEKPGAVSPLGIEEKEANLLLARQLARDLKKAGVNAVLGRSDDSHLELQERIDRARKEGADIFISIHHNSLAEYEDPREKTGSAVFYYHPPSRELAGAIGGKLKDLGLPTGGVVWKSLAVTRPTDLIAVLVEAAYLTNPDDETRLLDPDFHAQISGAITKALLEYVDSD